MCVVRVLLYSIQCNYIITVGVAAGHRVSRVTVVRQVPVGTQREIVLGPLKLAGQIVDPTRQRDRRVHHHTPVIRFDGEGLLG